MYFFVWYYSKAIIDFFKIWINFLKFFWFYYFPAPMLLKTLFSPWKGDITRLKGPGFDPAVFFQTLVFNLISRGIGFFLRLSLIIIVFAIEILVFAFGIAFLIFWLIWPLLLVLSIYLWDKLFLLVSLGFGAMIFVFYSFARQKPADQMELKEALSQNWTKIVWERVGLEAGEIPVEVLDNPAKNLENFLKSKKIKKDDFEAALVWEISKQKNDYVEKRFWRKENLFSVSGVARDWAYGYTPSLEPFIEPVVALENYEDLIGRREQLEMMERILLKGKQSNVLIVGEPGVGKMSLVHKFIRLVKSGKIDPVLSYKRVLLLDLKRALSGVNALGDLESRLIKIFDQARSAGNVILVINDFHDFVHASESASLGEKDISQIILPFLEGGFFQLIAVTTYEGLHEYIERRNELMKFFEKVEIKEPDQKTTKTICLDHVRDIERRVPIRITIQAIDAVVEKSDLYIADIPFPEKAIDLLEEAAIYAAKNTKDYFLKPEHVDGVISQKTEIPVGALTEKEKEKLADLENSLHQRVVNQNQAVESIASAMRRGRLEIAGKDRPIGSFLFLGPTGVGKTETAKALAEAYFGSEKRMNRFDMSEFQGANAVEKMIGSRQINSAGLFTTIVKENPFSLLLLDEIEKADYRVMNLFLQVLDEGWITDVLGKKINFRNQIIIATSNAGAEFIRGKIKENLSEEDLKKQLIDYVLSKNIFSPEFLNRFDGVIVFKPLTPENLLEISKLMLNKLKNRLSEQELIFNFSSELVRRVAELGYDPENGARPMRRVIQDKVEDPIAKKLLKGEIQKEVPFEIKI